MKRSIRIIKRKESDVSNEEKISEPEKSVEQYKREMVSTVKSWVAEFQRRKDQR
jgi:hypothetical protein